MSTLRIDGRMYNQNRPLQITNHYLMHPAGSVLIEMGNTKVICTATVEHGTARHLKGTGQGWITAEYGMLPASTGKRKIRGSSKGKLDGRSMEIQRLIGRSLRSAVDMQALGENTIWIDCDVIQADGGTRTASITGAFIAMVEAMKYMKENDMIDFIPVKNFVSAISVGLVNNQILLDLCYLEDSSASVDMNVVMTDAGEYIEIQGTGEESPFSQEALTDLLSIAKEGCLDLIAAQKELLGNLE